MKILHLALVAVVLALPSISFFPAAAQQKKEMAWSAPNVGSAAFWDILGAVELGYMEDEHLSLKIVNVDNPVQSMQFLATGAVQIVSASPELTISAVDKGADFKLVASENDRVAFVMFARPEVNGFAGLRNKSIGVTQLEETTATITRLLLAAHGVGRSDYEFVALGGGPNRFAALIRGAISGTMLSAPLDARAAAEGMTRFGIGFEVFDGVGCAFAVSDFWAKSHADALISFIRASARAQQFFFDAKNKERAIDIMMKYAGANASRQDIAASYHSFYVADKIMSPNAELTNALLQPWLDVRGSKANIDRYMDLTYWKSAREN